MTERSISPASRTLTGLTSTPKDVATDWMARIGRSQRLRRVAEDCHSLHARRDLLEELQPFPA